MCPFRIFPLESADRPAVEALLDLVFGQDRRNRSAYRLRAGNRPCPGLSFPAGMDGRLVGSVQRTPVAGEPADRVHRMALAPDIPPPQGELRPRQQPPAAPRAA